jgi:hypothetical protein
MPGAGIGQDYADKAAGISGSVTVVGPIATANLGDCREFRHDGVSGSKTATSFGIACPAAGHEMEGPAYEQMAHWKCRFNGCRRSCRNRGCSHRRALVTPPSRGGDLRRCPGRDGGDGMAAQTWRNSAAAAGLRSSARTATTASPRTIAALTNSVRVPATTMTASPKRATIMPPASAKRSRQRSLWRGETVADVMQLKADPHTSAGRNTAQRSA